MPTILAIETATEACSAALIIKEDNHSETKILQRFQLAPREHTKLILPMLDEILLEANKTLKDDVDAIAFSCGPGAFTGLRIATGIAQGLSMSIDKPVIPVSTLATLGLQACLENPEKSDNDLFIAALDARMGEVYWAVFKPEGDSIILMGEEKVSKPEDMLVQISQMLENENIVTIGSGWDVYEDALLALKEQRNSTHMESCYPRANAVVTLALDLFLEGKAQAPEEAQLIYIRNDVAKKPKPK